MSYSAQIIEIFLSSPADVQAERDLISQVAAEWNRLRGRETGCYMAILTWQDLVAPALGNRSQEVVNQQIGAEYDVYLSILWTRIGTETGAAESGTVEEFELALERARSEGGPRIAALFKIAPVDPSAIDAIQLQKVQEFKARIGDLGAFYREFSDEGSLRTIVNLLFEQLAKEAGKDLDEVKSRSHRTAAAEQSRISAAQARHEEEDEAGLIEVGEEFERLARVLVEQLQDIVEEEARNTETIQHCSTEISSLTSIGSLDADAAKAIVRRSSKSLKTLADHYEQGLSALDDIFAQMSRLVEADVRLRLEFDDPTAVAGDNIAAMRELAQTLHTSIQQLEELIATTSQLPPMSTELKKARNKLGRERGRLRDMLVSLLQTVENSIRFFEEQTVGSASSD